MMSDSCAMATGGADNATTSDSRQQTTISLDNRFSRSIISPPQLYRWHPRSRILTQSARCVVADTQLRQHVFLTPHCIDHLAREGDSGYRPLVPQIHRNTAHGACFPMATSTTQCRDLAEAGLTGESIIAHYEGNCRPPVNSSVHVYGLLSWTFPSGEERRHISPTPAPAPTDCSSF